MIAGHAALLALGLGESAYDGVGTIVVRGRAMRRTAPMAGPARGVLVDAPGAVDGEAHHADGPIMLVWPSARREAANPRLGRDVVLHEFSHKLDMLDGTLDGTPPIADDAARQRWIDVCTAEYRAVRDGTAGWLLRPYAGTNPAEFFAVATETFFTRPVPLRDEKPALYEVLRGYYGQDPARGSTARSELSARTDPIGPVPADNAGHDLATAVSVSDRDDLLAVGLEGAVLAVVLEVDGELVDPEVAQLVQPAQVLVDRAEDAEAVDDLVGHEVGVDVAGPAVLVVVVALAALDVVGQGGRHVGGVAVAADDVGDVVADHPAEPPALVAQVGEVVADVGRRGDADRDRVGVPAGVAPPPPAPRRSSTPRSAGRRAGG